MEQYQFISASYDVSEARHAGLYVRDGQVWDHKRAENEEIQKSWSVNHEFNVWHTKKKQNLKPWRALLWSINLEKSKLGSSNDVSHTT